MGNLVPAAQPDGTGHTGQAFDLLSRPTLPLVNIIVNIFIIIPLVVVVIVEVLGKGKIWVLTHRVLERCKWKTICGEKVEAARSR